METSNLRTRYGSAFVSHANQFVEAIWHGWKILLLLLILIFSGVAWHRYRNFEPTVCSLDEAAVSDICAITFNLVCSIDISDDVVCDVAHLAGLVCPSVRVPDFGTCPPDTTCRRSFEPIPGVCETLQKPPGHVCVPLDSCPLSFEGRCGDEGECISTCKEAECFVPEDCEHMLDFITSEVYINCEDTTFNGTAVRLCDQLTPSGLELRRAQFSLQCVYGQCMMRGQWNQNRPFIRGIGETAIRWEVANPNSRWHFDPYRNFPGPYDYVPASPYDIVPLLHRPFEPRNLITGFDDSVCNQAIWADYAGCFRTDQLFNAECMWWFACTNWDKAVQPDECTVQTVEVKWTQLRSTLQQAGLYAPPPQSSANVSGLITFLQDNIRTYGEVGALQCSVLRAGFTTVDVVLGGDDGAFWEHEYTFSHADACTASIPASESLALAVDQYSQAETVSSCQAGFTCVNMDNVVITYQCVQDAACFENPCPADNCGHDGATAVNPNDRLTCAGTKAICEPFIEDNGDCGSCGNACPIEPDYCQAGECCNPNAPNVEVCNLECVDTSSNNAHCGGCFNYCRPRVDPINPEQSLPETAECVNSACVYTALP